METTRDNVIWMLLVRFANKEYVEKGMPATQEVILFDNLCVIGTDLSEGMMSVKEAGDVYKEMLDHLFELPEIVVPSPIEMILKSNPVA